MKPKPGRRYLIDPTLPYEEQLYVLKDRDGDYVSGIQSTGWATVPIHFTFTKDKKQVRIFTAKELWWKLATNPPGIEFMKGFAGGQAIRIH